MKTENKVLKVVLPWGLLILGLLSLVYPKLTGHPLFPIFKYHNLSDYNVLLIPLIFIFSYASKAWGPMVFAFLLGGFLASFVPKERMSFLLSSKKKWSYILAAFSAPLLAVCSCVMIPIFGGLLAGGAGIGPAITFLLTAPSANVLAIIFTGNLISWKMAFARLLFSSIGAIIIGYIVSLTPWGKEVEERYKKLNIKIQTGSGIKRSFAEKSWQMLTEAIYLAKKVIPYLIAGLIVVAYVEAYFQKPIVMKYLTGIHGIFIAACIGIPTYTPTLVEVFFIKSMLKLGMSEPAALAFLIGGPMASIPSMMGVSSFVGYKVVITYAILGILTAFVAGLTYMYIF